MFTIGNYVRDEKIVSIVRQILKANFKYIYAKYSGLFNSDKILRVIDIKGGNRGDAWYPCFDFITDNISLNQEMILYRSINPSPDYSIPLTKDLKQLKKMFNSGATFSCYFRNGKKYGDTEPENGVITIRWDLSVRLDDLLMDILGKNQHGRFQDEYTKIEKEVNELISQKNKEYVNYASTVLYNDIMNVIKGGSTGEKT